MGLMNSSLQIGRSAILSYQGALTTVGNNISSAGSPDYTRLAPQLDPVHGTFIGRDLQPGAGVALTDVRRYIDEALENRFRLAIGMEQFAATRQAVVSQVESYFDDLSGAGVGARLTEFWTVFEELQNTPEDPAMRDLAVASGEQLAASLRSLREQLARLGADMDGQIADIVVRADQVARDIAELNAEITRAEAGRRGQATALRDQRDALLRELAEYFDVTVREQPDGAINVYTGSEALVQGAIVRGLIAVRQVDGEFARTSVRFADTSQQILARGGRLAGLIAARDQDAYGRIAAVDELAAAIIWDVNRVHANGQGLVGNRSLTGAYDVLDVNAALSGSAAGLAFVPRGGSFFVTVLDDATKTPVTYRIQVDLDGNGGDSTLTSLVNDFNNQVNGVTASITADQRISFTADVGLSFTFGYDGQRFRDDTSGVLAALGVNTFFSGTDAGNMQIAETIRRQPALIAAASVFLPGDGSNAGRIAALDEAVSERLSGLSLMGLHNRMVNQVAIGAASGQKDWDSALAIRSALQAQKESISGVNLDEESVSLLKFERAFQGAARFISVVDELLGELVALIR